MRRLSPFIFAAFILGSSLPGPLGAEAFAQGSGKRYAQRAEKKAKKQRKGALARKRPTELKLQSPAPSEDVTPADQTASAPPQRGPTRIDFDDRLIQGQTNKSGAVYLYERKELKQRSMIQQPDSFRDQIVGAVYGS